MPKIMISAAEVSGDVHGSHLVREIKSIDPSYHFFGIGGEQLKNAGVDIKYDITSKSTIGIIEAIKHIPSHVNMINLLKKMMDDEKPDALILVDAQGFNMPLAVMARSKGIKTIYYIAPQEWLWGTEKGVKKVVDTIDLIVSIFEKEHQVYQKAGGKSVYFGHPLLDFVRKNISKEDLIKRYRLDPKKKIISLCPGSRSQEITRFLPMLIAAAIKINEILSNVQFVLPLSSSLFKNEIKSMTDGSGLDLTIVEKDNYNALGNSDLIIAVSGTIVLESVILGVPVIMFYKLSLLTYLIGKYILKISLPYYSMPNILANKSIVPEYVMGNANPDNLSKEAINLLGDQHKTEEMKNAFKKITFGLGDIGVIPKAARSVVDYLTN